MKSFLAFQVLVFSIQLCMCRILGSSEINLDNEGQCIDIDDCEPILWLMKNSQDLKNVNKDYVDNLFW